MTTSLNKPLKWATQRVHHVNKTSYRIQKKKTIVKEKVISHQPKEELKKLEKELAFTFDSIATITVHFDSLRQAYLSSEPQLQKTKSATRLCEMEKELLTAYDDLKLQMNHLERNIHKLETRIQQLKQQEAYTHSSPCSTTASPMTATSISSPMTATSISSPCSSITTDISPNMTFMPIDWLFEEPTCQYVDQDFLFNPYYYDIMNQPLEFY